MLRGERERGSGRQEVKQYPPDDYAKTFTAQDGGRLDRVRERSCNICLHVVHTRWSIQWCWQIPREASGRLLSNHLRMRRCGHTDDHVVIT